jgi:hypothetical protein
MDGDVVNFTSPTFTILDIEEGVNGMDVLTNNLKESGNGDVAIRPTNIVGENEGEFNVIKNQLGFTTKNASKIISIPSNFIIHGLPSFGCQDVNIQFGHLFN